MHKLIVARLEYHRTLFMSRGRQDVDEARLKTGVAQVLQIILRLFITLYTLYERKASEKIKQFWNKNDKIRNCSQNSMAGHCSTMFKEVQTYRNSI